MTDNLLRDLSKKILRFLIPGVPGRAYDRCRPVRGGSAFRKAILKRTERELAGPGRPGMVDEAGWQKVERREAQRPPPMGARGLTVPREVGPSIPPQRVPRKHSGASRRSIALA